MSEGAPPLIREVSKPWWDALARGEMEIQNCAACEGWVFYPRHFCTHCGERDLHWKKVDPAATLYSWTIAEVPVAGMFAHLLRPVMAIAELGIGIRFPTTLVDVAAPSIGMPLAPVFDSDTYPGVTLLRYRPTP